MGMTHLKIGSAYMGKHDTMVTFGKFIAHGCDPQKCGEFLWAFFYKIQLWLCSGSGTWVRGASCISYVTHNNK